jgi:hypothetical protein
MRFGIERRTSEMRIGSKPLRFGCVRESRSGSPERFREVLTVEARLELRHAGKLTRRVFEKNRGDLLLPAFLDDRGVRVIDDRCPTILQGLIDDCL